jgi:hypothetical protein
MKIKTKIILSTTLSTILASTSILTYTRIRHLNNQNDRLKAELKDTKDEQKYLTLDKVYEDLQEINKKNVNLIVYEAKSNNYKRTLTDNKFVESQLTLTTKYSYYVTLDLSKTIIHKNLDSYLVFIDFDNIALTDINIEPMNIENNLNIWNRWKGVTISEMTSTAIKQSAKDIEELVLKDYESNKYLIEARTKEKIEKLYKGLPVKVIFVSEDNASE